MERDSKRKRELKDQRKRRLADRKIRILKNFYLNDDNKLKVSENKLDLTTKVL